MAAARTALRLVVWTAIGFVFAIAVCVAAPALVGGHSLTVLSGSMAPTLETGSVVLGSRIAPGAARPGDVITFTDPAKRGQTLTHRLVSARAERDRWMMVTKGDANDAPERWSVPSAGTIGRVDFHVPKAGYAREFVSTRAARLVLVALVIALGLFVLVDIWRPRAAREGYA